MALELTATARCRWSWRSEAPTTSTYRGARRAGHWLGTRPLLPRRPRDADALGLPDLRRLQCHQPGVEYVWVTNEFDPARLVANATAHNAPLFSAVVHVNPDAVRLVHELDHPKLRRKLAELKTQLETGRITGLSDWLTTL